MTADDLLTQCLVAIQMDLQRVTSDATKKNRVLSPDEAKSLVAYTNLLRSMVIKAKPSKKSMASILERLKDYPEIAAMLGSDDGSLVDDRITHTQSESDGP